VRPRSSSERSVQNYRSAAGASGLYRWTTSPPDQREGYPQEHGTEFPQRLSTGVTDSANLAEVIHLTRMEVGPTDFDFVGYIRFLRSGGMSIFGGNNSHG